MVVKLLQQTLWKNRKPSVVLTIICSLAKVRLWNSFAFLSVFWKTLSLITTFSEQCQERVKWPQTPRLLSECPFPQHPYTTYPPPLLREGLMCAKIHKCLPIQNSLHKFLWRIMQLFVHRNSAYFAARWADDFYTVLRKEPFNVWFHGN